jgi:hypothetical protein
MTKTFDRLAANNGGILAVTGLPGAVANGLGYRSLSHVTAVPKLEFWRIRFPEMSTTEFETIFNRYSHIVPVAESTQTDSRGCGCRSGRPIPKTGIRPLCSIGDTANRH